MMLLLLLGCCQSESIMSLQKRVNQSGFWIKSPQRLRDSGINWHCFDANRFVYLHLSSIALFFQSLFIELCQIYGLLLVNWFDVICNRINWFPSHKRLNWHPVFFPWPDTAQEGIHLVFLLLLQLQPGIELVWSEWTGGCSTLGSVGSSQQVLVPQKLWWEKRHFQQGVYLKPTTR